MHEYAQTMKAAKIALPAVVGILVSKELSQLEQELGTDFLKSGSPLLKYLTKPGAMDNKGMVRVAGCSGFFITPDGYILTNRHVVSDESAEYTIIWQDKKYPVKIVARDPNNDIAVLKCEVKNAPYLRFGNSSTLQLGQTVLAIGNALGEFQNTVSRGIVSGLSRYIKTQDEQNTSQEFKGLIQTDAAINPGNSGGPLIDLYGRAIGINAVTVLEVENIGFAIPINQAKKALDQIKTYGRICQTGLGIRYVLVDDEIQKRHNLAVNHGAYIVYESDGCQPGVIKNSRADKAGIKEGDIIIECAREMVSQGNPLQQILDKQKVGDEIELKIVRDKKEIPCRIKLEC